MRIDAGRLDRRLIVLDLIEDRDESHMPFTEWRAIDEIFAGNFPLLAHEVMSQVGREAISEGKFLIRYKPWLKPTMRLRLDDTTYTITGIQEIGRREGQWVFVTSVTEGQ